MKEKITAYQLFILMILLPYGSAILFLLIPEIEQDAWIAMLFYGLIGIVLQLIYLALYNSYPKDTLVTYLPKIYGVFLGNILSIVYICYFTYIASRVLRDFEEILFHSGLNRTPMIITGIVFMVIVTYSVFSGIECIANTIQLLFFMILLSPTLIWFISLLSPDFAQFSSLQPILDEGFITTITNSWRLIAFPYGETIAFTMLYPFVIESSKIKKVAIASIVVESILLSLNSILFITTVGVDHAGSYISAFLAVARSLNLGFIERIDAFFVIVLVLGGFIKISILMYIAVLGTSQMTKLKCTKLLATIFGIIILILSRIIAKNYSEHIYIGLYIVVKYIHIPLQVIIPSFTLFLNYIKQKNFLKPITK